MTTLGTAVLAGGTLLSLVATVLLAVGYVRRDDRFDAYVIRLVAGGSGLFVAALSLLTYQFVTTDYTNAYVWQNTADYLPLLYRVTGVYASNAGSLLLWATIASLVVAWATWRRGLADAPSRLVAALTTGAVAYFGTMLLLDSPFTHVSTVVSGGVPTTGNGLNPLLIDPYMAIHPPLMFIAYALLTMPFAIGVAHFVGLVRSGEGLFRTWNGSVTRWLRAAWLFLTAALALGALWSYTVLGWGGIWAWDPVETAIFIPWLFLTATLHAVVNYRPGDRYSVLAPAMVASTFALVVYTTTVVRSGVFRSVHSFADNGAGLGMLLLVGATAVLGVGLPLGFWLLREEDDATDDGEWLTRSTLLHGAVLALGLLAFISLWGLTFPVLRDLATGIEVEVTARYYNRWSYPVTLLTMLLLGFYMDFDVEGKRRALAGLGVFAAATVVAALYAPSPAWQLGAGTEASGFYALVGQLSALSAFPPVAYVLMAVVKRALDRIPGAPRRTQLKQTGVMLVHVGVAVLVFSLAFTYLFTGQASVIVGGGGANGGQVDVPNSPYAVQALGFETYSLPEDPNVEGVALSTTELQQRGAATNGTTQAVHGTVTDMRQGPRATVYQLDDSGIWVGVTSPNGTAGPAYARGDAIVARGAVMWNYVPQTDAVVVTDPTNVGTTASPPDSLGLERVRVQAVNLAVIEGNRQVAVGQAAQRRYPRQGGMQTRDVLIDRGLAYDTYVIAAVQGDTASLTVKRIPLMTPLRLSIVSLLVGMLLIFLFDPAHGVWTRPLAPAAETDSDPTTSD
ncbi:cytochrome c biogenesis protein CcsA [Halorientalis brevis]|uniref:Cytochrome c biogenesis protein CcsA n=1 Tax=Halorientalis brevis TaxID=1126241 RepID=A0ABD6C997_9EURY|nr:cytochrome c biogenesis protein CcsA [Halorientalis brevis]